MLPEIKQLEDIETRNDLIEAIAIEQELRNEILKEKGLWVEEEVLTVEEFKRRLAE